MKKEIIFNIFLPCKSGSEEISEYHVKSYEVSGTDKEKKEFLKTCVIDDFNTGKTFYFKVNVNGKVSGVIPLRVITNLISVNLNVFEEAFEYFNGPAEPLYLLTHVIDGEPYISVPFKKINKNSLNALISRGIDNYTAKMLLIQGLNLRELQLKPIAELKKIGLKNQQIDRLHKGPRPPIPEEIVIRLLYESKRTCCVCRDPGRPIVIHHIEAWSSSGSHDISNLVVLCLDHHDLAHTKKSLSLNLDKKQLISFKQRWLEQVKFDDSKAVLNLINESHSRWDYFNLSRIFELFFEFNIDFRDTQTFPILNRLGIVNEIGVLTGPGSWKISKSSRRYYSDFGEGIVLNYYIRTILERIILKLPLLDLTNRVTKNDFKSLLRTGSYFTVQLGFYFSDLKDGGTKQSTRRKGYYKGNGITIEFTFESFNCSSSSARYDHLTSHNIINPILLVKDILTRENQLLISCSCLAIGSYFNNNKIGRYGRGPIGTPEGFDDDGA